MCLSTVYAVLNDNENKLCEYVCNVEVDGNSITLTDIMGAQTKVQGTLKSMDFVKNRVIIECEN